MTRMVQGFGVRVTGVVATSQESESVCDYILHRYMHTSYTYIGVGVGIVEALPRL